MNTNYPILYVKTGCPYAQAARDFLDENGISYEERNFSDDPAAREELRRISGKEKSPTLDFHGDALADFDVNELIEFLQAHNVELEES